MEFYIVDVFTDNGEGGSQLGVFLCEDWPTDAKMLAIAKELGFAEVTFMKKVASANTFDMRIFTVNYELPFAGHPTLGTAWIARKHFGVKENNLKLVCKLGDVPVNFSDNSDAAIVTMEQHQPIFGSVFNPNEITAFTNLRQNDFDIKMPIQRVAIGANFLIVPILSEKALDSVTVNYEAWLGFLKTKKLHMSTSKTGLTSSLYLYTPLKGQKTTYKVRMFSDQYNIPDEDAATGSAAGCLLAYILKQKKLARHNAIIKQGQALGRTSELYINGAYDGKQFDLKVGGKVKYVAKGEWATNV